jgi:Cytochrome c7 and related cytochrome c
MPQLFSPRADLTLRISAVAVGGFSMVLLVAIWAFARSPAATGQYHSARQPMPFAHTLHANGLRIDCRYCHTGAERSSMAGLPPTQACVPCHREATLHSTLFAPVRNSLATGRPIPWRRITSVPDFVFFNHAAHVRHGVACETCHGPVQLMNDVYQAAPLTMEWCVDCHRFPERHVAGHERVRRLTSCTTCHR